MKPAVLILLSSLFLQTSLFSEEKEAISSFNKNSLSITPEEMVFASKLSEKNRRLFCYKFSIQQRQQAVETWKESVQGEQARESSIASLSPDDAVDQITHQEEVEQVSDSQEP